jgi:ribosomal protein L37AE/L43A
MSFDDIPEDEQMSYECPNCGGNVTQSEHGVWYCDRCAFNSDMPIVEDQVNGN